MASRVLATPDQNGSLRSLQARADSISSGIPLKMTTLITCERVIATRVKYAGRFGMANSSFANGDKQIQAAIDGISKQYGKESLISFKDGFKSDVEWIHSGSLNLDLALGGGIPRGRIIEMFGPPSSGKTTCCLHVCAEVQKAGGRVVYIDAEHALDPKWAERIGVSVSSPSFLFSQPGCGEEALGICDALCRAGVDLIVVDSVAALVPKVELEGEMGQSHVGLLARMMSQAMRKLAGICKQKGSTVLFINQTREKVGVMFGSPITTPGGNALKFAASQRIDIARIAAVKQGENVIGQRVRAKIVKNKVSPPLKVAEFEILYHCGISFENELLDLGVANKVVAKSGSWYSYGDMKLGQGKEGARLFLVENPDVRQKIHEQLLPCIRESVE